uniref:Pm3-like protein n=1 Tax=Triticum aestivum TaxID=4565 RepID=D0QEK7_WHEAT|nr:Pm3-like protein [Triticum aestivum]
MATRIMVLLLLMLLSFSESTTPYQWTRSYGAEADVLKHSLIFLLTALADGLQARCIPDAKAQDVAVVLFHDAGEEEQWFDPATTGVAGAAEGQWQNRSGTDCCRGPGSMAEQGSGMGFLFATKAASSWSSMVMTCTGKDMGWRSETKHDSLPAKEEKTKHDLDYVQLQYLMSIHLFSICVSILVVRFARLKMVKQQQQQQEMEATEGKLVFGVTGTGSTWRPYDGPVLKYVHADSRAIMLGYCGVVGGVYSSILQYELGLDLLRSFPAFSRLEPAEESLFSDHDVEGSVKDDLTPELIDAAVTFVEAAAWSKKNMTKRVYYNERGTSVIVESIRPIIDAYQTHLALRIGHDRHLCLAWRSKYLVDRAKARDNPKPSKYNMDSALSRAGAVRRVLDEYTVRDKTLDIMGNSRLTSLESMSAEHPPSLETLSLFDCTTLASLPNEPQTYGSLKNLTIFGCPAIKILPRCLQQRLDSLDYKWLDARYEVMAFKPNTWKEIPRLSREQREAAREARQRQRIARLFRV